MGWGFKDIAAVFNPVAAIGTGAAIGSDYLAMEEGQREASRARTHADEQRAADYAMQKEFAQMGIRWRAEDAKAAGLHPMAAIGGSGAGFTPSGVVVGVDNSRSEFLSRTGQNISRAINATRTFEERLEERLR